MSSVLQNDSVISKIYRVPILIKNEMRANVLSRNYKISGKFKRIYFYHIRKAGGTSVNFMFLASSTSLYDKYYKKMAQSLDNRVIIGNKVFVGWNPIILSMGKFYYGFSHRPIHKIHIPNNTFDFTIIRNPVDRLISYYKMVRHYQYYSGKNPLSRDEKRLLMVDDLKSFLRSLEKERMYRQIYMFSKNFDIDEAYNRITNLSYFFFTENFEEGVNHLNKKLKINLKMIKANQGSFSFFAKYF